MTSSLVIGGVNGQTEGATASTEVLPPLTTATLELAVSGGPIIIYTVMVFPLYLGYSGPGDISS